MNHPKFIQIQALENGVVYGLTEDGEVWIKNSFTDWKVLE